MKKLLFFLFINATLLASAQKSVQIPVVFDNSIGDYLQTSEVKAAPNDVADFYMLSAYSFATQHATIYFRLKRDNQWLQWTGFENAHGMETQARQAFEGQFIYGAFDSIQFASSGGLDKEVIFRLYLAGVKKDAEKLEDSSIKNLSVIAACACAQPLICKRNCWCPDGSCPKDSSPTTTQVSHLIVHHSAGGNSATDFAAVVASYWDLHVNTNGWDDIGYNWLIDPNGIVYEGRGSGALGAHFSCANQNTTGICLIGNFMLTEPSDTALSSLKQLLAWESCDKNIVLSDTSFHGSSQLMLPHVSSHRDANISTAPNACPKGTLCPGDSLYRKFYGIAQEAAALVCNDGVNLTEQKTTEFSLYPNPTTNQLNIQLGDAFFGKQIKLTVYNSVGKPIVTKLITQGNLLVELNVNALKSGLYLLEIQRENTAARKVFIKE